MSNQNHFFVGNLTRDPELRSVNGKNGVTSVVSFSVAVNGRKDEEPVYFDCEAWAQGAELIAKFFKKGTPIVVLDSEARNDSWTDKESGQKRSKLKFRVNRFGFAPLNSKAGEAPNETEEEEPAPAPAKTAKAPASKTNRKAPTPPPPVEDADVEDDDSEIPF